MRTREALGSIRVTASCPPQPIRAGRVTSIFSLVLVAAILMATGASARNVVEVIARDASVALGDPEIVLDVEINFAEATVGGGFEIDYDPTRLEFLDFTFVNDPQMLIRTAPAAGSTAQPLVFGAGWLVFTPPFGVVGQKPLGTLRFRPVGTGQTLIDVSPSAISPGPFYPPQSSDTPLVVEYVDEVVTVVPEPGFASLALCGVFALCTLGRSKRSGCVPR